MQRILSTLFVFSLLASSAAAQAPRPDIVGVHQLPGMDFAGRISRDGNGIIQILAFNRHDLYFLNGYAHAHDRLFQMDFFRRTASGTLAELVGPAALPSDVQLRTVGLRRAAEFSFATYSPRAQQALQAYAAGVNAYLQSRPQLPPEYAALEISQIPPWSPIDSVAVGKLISFSLAFDLSDISATIALRTYQGIGQAAGFDGVRLFFDDLFRSAPFDRASTVPDARSSSTEPLARSQDAHDEQLLRSFERAVEQIHPIALELGQRYLEELDRIELFRALRTEAIKPGSNEWAVAGRHTTTNRPMMANDPHLALDVPATFTPIVLRAGRINVAGHSFAGTPGVILGHNDRIAWGATKVGFDVTDVYQEQVVPDSRAPAGLAVMIRGQREFLFPIVQVFRQNNIGNGTMNDVTVVPAGGPIPPATLIVTRRNAPIIALDTSTGIALSVQTTGFYATRELETFLLWAEAEDLEDFRDALQFFDFGAQNWVYTDVDGNIAYFTSGEVPIREDLQQNRVEGLPPSFIRSGAGGNDWIRELNPPPGQATPAAIIPFSEMPQVVNPASGWFVNANNDPGGNTLDNNPLNDPRPGGGLLYYGRWFANGLRAGRITQMIRAELQGGGKISFEEMKAMQGDVVMLDAQFFVPFVSQAFDNAQAASAPPPLAQLAANPAIAGAVNRLRSWNFSAPTGIPEGYDFSDVAGNLSAPSQQEIDHSVAATIYSVWRSRIIANTIDAVLEAIQVQAGVPVPRPDNELVLAALRNLLENFATRGGAGASGTPFFNVPGVPNIEATAPLRRDLLMLASLGQALQLLAGDAFAPAFNRSVNQADYRWGRLHRIVFDHPLGGPLSIPPAGGAFPAPLAGLPGIPVDGGYETVDASGHSPRAATVNGFMFGSGPVRRFVAEGDPGGIRAETSLPGGASGVIGDPFFMNLLKPWLTNETYPSILLQGPRLPFVPD